MRKGKGQQRIGPIREQWHGGLSGRGKNITTAKADLADKIDAALEGSYTPILVHVADSPLSALVWRDLHGWQYTIIGLSEMPSGERVSMMNGSTSEGPDATVKQVEDAARRHLAQCILEFNGKRRTGMEVLTNDVDMLIHERYVILQWVYRVWYKSGLDMDAAMDKAFLRQFPDGVDLVWSEDKATAKIVQAPLPLQRRYQVAV